MKKKKKLLAVELPPEVYNEMADREEFVRLQQKYEAVEIDKQFGMN